MKPLTPISSLAAEVKDMVTTADRATTAKTTPLLASFFLPFYVGNMIL